MSQVSEVVLPKEVVKAERLSPKILVLYSQPKMGKTTAVSKIKDCLILDLEDGTALIDALKIKVNSLEELGKVAKAIKDAGKPYKYIAIDTISKLEEWCEIYAKTLYMRTPMGKNFTGDSVLELPNGGGYLYLREAYKKWINYLTDLSDRVILIGHLKDKMIEKKGKEVSAKDLDLIGKIRSMTCARADAIGYLYREEDKLLINFVSQEETLCGSRCEHLKGQVIELGNKDDLNWNKIYVD